MRGMIPLDRPFVPQRSLYATLGDRPRVYFQRALTVVINRML